MTAPRSPFKRGHWYKGMKFDPRIDNLLSERDEKRHTELRAKLMPGYTAKEVPKLEDKINQRVLDLVNLIQNDYVAKGSAFDFSKVVQYFTLDSLTGVRIPVRQYYVAKQVADRLGQTTRVPRGESGLVRLQQILHRVLSHHGTGHQYPFHPLDPVQQAHASTGWSQA